MALRKNPAPVERPINSPVFERQMLRLPTDRIHPHPKNPNVGDMDSLGESIDELGQFDPMIWNRRNEQLVAGHHTWLSLRKRGWTEFDVIVVDVDEETHLRMMLAHNAVGAKSRREEHTLTKVLAELEAAGATRGTGYTPAEISKLVAQSDAAIASAKASMARADQDAATALDGVESPDLDDLDEADPGLDSDFEGLAGDLPGAYTLKSGLMFPGVGEWQIPELLPEMIPTYDELPHDIVAWAGSATRDWPDPDQWWLYNIKVDSTSGMRDLSKAIPSFYVYDEYIDVWWNKLSQYVSRMLYSGMQFAVSPDFSPASGGEARFNSLESLFKNRYMARYMQQAGIKVIPNINWSMWDEAFLVEHTLPTLPPNPPMIAMQIQTATTQARDKGLVAEQAEAFGRQVQLILDTVNPGGLLCYYGKVGKELFEEQVTTEVPIIWVEGRTNRLGERGKRNMKKLTL